MWIFKFMNFNKNLFILLILISLIGLCQKYFKINLSTLSNIKFSRPANIFQYNENFLEHYLKNSVNLWREEPTNPAKIDIGKNGQIRYSQLKNLKNTIFYAIEETKVKKIYVRSNSYNGTWWNGMIYESLNKTFTSGLGSCKFSCGNDSIEKISRNGFDAIFQIFDNFKWDWDHDLPPISSQIIPKNMSNFLFSREAPLQAYAKLLRKNDYLVTYWRGSDIYNPYFTWTYDDPEIKIKEQGIDFSKEKSKMAVIFVSNCKLSTNNRMGYVQELQKYLQVDIFGECGGNKSCPKLDENCMKNIIKDYYFYLAFENSNCRDYITEKFLNAIRYGAVPVVLGEILNLKNFHKMCVIFLGAHPNDYKEILPENSYVNTEDFSTPQELAQFLLKISSNSTKYNEYFQWIGTGKIEEYRFTNEKFSLACTLVHYYDYIKPPDRTSTLEWDQKTFCLPQNEWKWKNWNFSNF